MLDGCRSIGEGVVAVFASAALGWRLPKMLEADGRRDEA
jgi:hypothetical protein